MPKAIYEGIYREIRSRIINGTYAFQEMLPTEAELTAEFGCTRNTVRRALGMLEMCIRDRPKTLRARCRACTSAPWKLGMRR